MANVVWFTKPLTSPCDSTVSTGRHLAEAQRNKIIDHCSCHGRGQGNDFQGLTSLTENIMAITAPNVHGQLGGSTTVVPHKLVGNPEVRFFGDFMNTINALDVRPSSSKLR